MLPRQSPRCDPPAAALPPHDASQSQSSSAIGAAIPEIRTAPPPASADPAPQRARPSVESADPPPAPVPHPRAAAAHQKAGADTDAKIPRAPNPPTVKAPPPARESALPANAPAAALKKYFAPR